MSFYFPDGNGGKIALDSTGDSTFLTVQSEISCTQSELNSRLPPSPADGDLVLWTDADSNLEYYLVFFAEQSQWYNVSGAITLTPINNVITVDDNYIGGGSAASIAVSVEPAEFTGRPNFNDGFRVLGTRPSFLSGLAVSNSVGANAVYFGSHNKITAKNLTVDADSTNFDGDFSLTGEVTANYLTSGGFRANNVSIGSGGLKTADSISCKIGFKSEFDVSSNNVKMRYATIDATGASISGAPVFTGAPSFNSGLESNGRATLAGGFEANSVLSILREATISAVSVSADLNRASVNASNASISGDPVFTGTPTFKNGAVGLSTGEGTYDVATTTTPGLMSASDKTKLNEIVLVGSGRNGKMTIEPEVKFETGINLDSDVVSINNTTFEGNTEFTSLCTFKGGINAKTSFIDATAAKISLVSASITGSADFNDFCEFKGGLKSSGKFTAASVISNFTAASIEGNPIFIGNVKFKSGFETDRSVLALSNSTINGEITFQQPTTFQKNIAATSISGNTAFTGTPIFKTGFSAEDEVTLSGGIEAESITSNLRYGTLALNAASISGNPVFTGTPTFKNGAVGLSTGEGTYDVATTTTPGLMSASDKAKLNNIADNANNFSLTAATETKLGGVKVGDKLSIDDGTLNVPLATAEQFGVMKIGYGLYKDSSNATVLRTASTNVLGGIKVGTGLYMSGESLNADYSNLPTASATTKGGIKIGAGLSMSGDSLNCAVASFTSPVTLSGGFVAKSVTSDLSGASITASNATLSGNIKIRQGLDASFNSDPGLDFNSSKLIMTYSDINVAGSSIKAGVGGGRATITGTPLFTETPSLAAGFNNMSDIRFANGKLQIISGGVTYTFTPDT